MQTEAITHNEYLLGHIEHDGTRYTAIVCGDEIICKTREEAIQVIYDVNPPQ
jgi:hypothetical protein